MGANGSQASCNARKTTARCPSLGIHTAAAQIPSKKDEDRFAIEVLSPHGKIVSLGDLQEEAEGQICCLGIYDGHGGPEVAELLRKRLFKTIVREAEKDLGKKGDLKFKNGIPEKYIVKAYQKLDYIAGRDYDLSGSTALNLIISSLPDGSRIVQCVWCGDSRASYFTGKKLQEYEDLSVDHDPLSSSEWERISEFNRTYGGAILTRRRDMHGNPVGPMALFKDKPEKCAMSLTVTRSIGDVNQSKALIPDPEITSFRVGPNEKATFFMGSDGVWKTMTNARARTLIRSSKTCTKSATLLCQDSAVRCRQRRFRADDITVLLSTVEGKHFQSRKSRR